jgi:hypothetical protein
MHHPVTHSRDLAKVVTLLNSLLQQVLQCLSQLIVALGK